MTAPAPRSFTERLPLPIHWGWALAAALLLSALALFVRWEVSDLLPAGYPYITFFPAVILSSFLFGARIGAVTGFICGLLAWYFFIPPAGFALGPGVATALAFYVFVVATDVLLVHWMQAANQRVARERELSRALAETRELLFNELQHRVSNNLQVAASLISLQKRRVSDSYAREALDEASRRLALIGRISRQLYDAGGSTRNMSEFLAPLCHDVIEASGRTGLRCEVKVEDAAMLSPDAAIPLALIVAEAMTNAIEHGFEGRETGVIEVNLSREGDRVRVEVHDDGNGLPDGFDIAGSGSLGLQIARTLAETMKGSFALERGDRTTARLLIPA